MEASLNGSTGQLSAKRKTFILRVWQESESGAEWRGQILDIHSGKTTAILNAAELLAYIQNQGQPTLSPPAKRPGLL